MWINPQFPANLVIFTKEILKKKRNTGLIIRHLAFYKSHFLIFHYVHYILLSSLIISNFSNIIFSMLVTQFAFLREEKIIKKFYAESYIHRIMPSITRVIWSRLRVSNDSFAAITRVIWSRLRVSNDSFAAILNCKFEFVIKILFVITDHSVKNIPIPLKHQCKINGVPVGVRGVRGVWKHPLRMFSTLFLSVKCPFCPLFHFKTITLLKVFYDFTKFLNNFT